MRVGSSQGSVVRGQRSDKDWEDQVRQGYKDLVVWQRSIELVKRIYTLTASFPREEMFGLTGQMRRSAVQSQAILRKVRAESPLANANSFLVMREVLFLNWRCN